MNISNSLKDKKRKIQKIKYKMAIILYPNGLTESIKPANLVFTEEELVNLFNKFDKIKTFRLLSILNTWCVYGNKKVSDSVLDYNKIASEIIEEDIYFHAVFIHDSEINPEWKVTDNILYNNYDDFIIALTKLIEDVANNILTQISEETNIETDSSKLPQLISLGTTKDKKVVFGYNVEQQNKEFYESTYYDEFVKKVYTYINTNKQTYDSFVIYSDQNSMVIIETEKVNKFLNSLIDKFKSKEEYEICTNISNILKSWESGKNNTEKKPRKRRVSKNKKDEK